jgi:hypothetical protein
MLPHYRTLFEPMKLQDWANVATILGALIASGALAYAAYQVHKNTLISRGQFWLELEKMFSVHNDTHLKLRPGGEWAGSGKGPSTVKEWAEVEDYMGLFEHCESLMEKGLIDLDTFKSFFSYRLVNILANQHIVQAKLHEEKDDWTKFLQLVQKLNLTVPT